MRIFDHTRIFYLKISEASWLRLVARYRHHHTHGMVIVGQYRIIHLA